MWVKGDNKQAKDLWVNWLVHEFSKYCLNTKSKGGMFQGSVHQNALKYIYNNKKLVKNNHNFSKILNIN